MFGSRSSKKFYKEILPNFYYFAEDSMLDCNIYVIKDEEDNLTIIDLGNGLSLDALETSFHELGWNLNQINRIVITHDHLDHMMGLYKLKEKLTNEFPQIIAHSYTAEMIKRGNEKEIIPSLFGISAKRFNIKILPIENVTSLSEGDTIQIGQYSFSILYTPGHSKGSICFYESSAKLLISGDVVFPNGSFGRYDFPGCSLKDLKESIRKLSALDAKYLCSGHMSPVESQASKHLQMSYAYISGMR